VLGDEERVQQVVVGGEHAKREVLILRELGFARVRHVPGEDGGRRGNGHRLLDGMNSRVELKPDRAPRSIRGLDEARWDAHANVAQIHLLTRVAIVVGVLDEDVRPCRLYEVHLGVTVLDDRPTRVVAGLEAAIDERGWLFASASAHSPFAGGSCRAVRPGPASVRCVAAGVRSGTSRAPRRITALPPGATARAGSVAAAGCQRET